MESLSSYGNLERLIDVEGALGGYWAWLGQYGDKLLDLFKSLDVGPKQPKQSKLQGTRGEKHASLPRDGGSGVNKDQPKQQRTSNMVEIPPTTVNPQPGPSSSRTLPPPSTPIPPPPPYHHAQLPTTMPLSPLSNNPYAALATPQPNYYQLPQMQYMPVHSYYYPTHTPLLSSCQEVFTLPLLFRADSKQT